jgi:hypothetical protein
MPRKWSKTVVAGFAAAAVGGLAIAGAASADPADGAARLRVCNKGTSGDQTVQVQGRNQNNDSVVTPFWTRIPKGGCAVIADEHTDWWWQIGQQLTVNVSRGNAPVVSHQFTIPRHENGIITESGIRNGGTFSVIP